MTMAVLSSDSFIVIHPSSLARSRLGPEGGKAIAKALEGNKTLTSLKYVSVDQR